MATTTKAPMYDTPVGVGGKINTNTGQILSGAMAGQKAGTDTAKAGGGTTYTPAPGTPPATPTKVTPQGPVPTTALNNAQVNAPVAPLAGEVPYDQAKTNLAAGGLAGGDLTAAQGVLANKYQKQLSTLQSNGTPVAQDAGTAKAKIASVTPPAVDNTQADIVLADNKAHQQFLDDYTTYQSSANQQQTLLQTYKEMTNQLGIPALNTELMNMKNVIDGTQDDIRNEVQKAGGFATNSQVLALTDARNKVMIQNYNNLLQTRDDAQKNLTTMIGLSEQDRAYASKQIDQQLNFDAQQIQFADKALTNAQDSLKNTATTYGWNAVLDSAMASGDPTAVQKINSTMGNGFNLENIAGKTPLGSYQVVKGGTDAFGNTLPDRIFNSKTGQFTNGGTSNYGGTTLGGSGGLTAAPGGGVKGTTGLSFDQYGLLAKTNFNPGDFRDNLAQKYLDQYIKNGTVPTASSLGRNMKPEAMAQVDSRARELYYQATGQSMPTPELIKGYQQQLTGNNKLLNSLNVQEGVVGKNAELLLKNLSANNLNTSTQPLNAFIDGVRNMLGDPNVAQYLAQNATVSNELGSLLSLKNAQGTTVYDKLIAADLINKGDTQGQIASKVKILLQEAVNSHDTLLGANAELYKQTDPLMQDANNPMRGQVKNQGEVESLLNAQGLHYDSLVSEMTPQAPAGTQPALDASTGAPVFATPEEIKSGKYVPL